MADCQFNDDQKLLKLKYLKFLQAPNPGVLEWWSIEKTQVPSINTPSLQYSNNISCVICEICGLKLLANRHEVF